MFFLCYYYIESTKRFDHVSFPCFSYTTTILKALSVFIISMFFLCYYYIESAKRFYHVSFPCFSYTTTILKALSVFIISMFFLYYYYIESTKRFYHVSFPCFSYATTILKALSECFVCCSVRLAVHARDRGLGVPPAVAGRGDDDGQAQGHPGPPQLVLPGCHALRHVLVLHRVRRHSAPAAHPRRPQ